MANQSLLFSLLWNYRQDKEKQNKEIQRHGEGHGPQKGQEEVRDVTFGTAVGSEYCTLKIASMSSPELFYVMRLRTINGVR